eukprot:10884428-Alexandrium_andersonii.AAC.1
MPLPAHVDRIITRFWCVLDPVDRALPESMGSDDPRTLETARRVHKGVEQDHGGISVAKPAESE